METTPVVDGDLSVSKLVLGTMTFGAQVDEHTAAEMVDVAAEAGITMIDTANGYAGGESERILGSVLKGRREEFALATKAGMPNPDAGGHAPLSREGIRRCLTASLDRMGTDRVEVFYLHQPDRSTPVAETLQACAELRAEGLIGSLGVSNFAAWQVAELVSTAAELDVPAPVLSQPLYNLLGRRIEEEYVEYAQHAGLLNIVYNPLGGGLLTGKHSFEVTETGGRFGGTGLGPMYRERYWNAELFAAVDALQTLAADHGLSLVELSFRWLLSRPATGAVLLGASNVDHLRANIAAASGPAPDQAVLDGCDEVWQRLRGPAPAYNR